ncbi:MAG: BamA/TamA family outer membrane protein, partial [Candidatus Eisenbacteria bacterium]|nr:BamA/TamA family outer membrane protein [Candidatus Eisenbacteria bacterium]
PEKVGELLKRIAASRNVDRSIRHVTGMSMQKLSEQWLEEVRKTYMPQIANHEKPANFSKRLTDAARDRTGFNLSPAVSPTGDKVVFVTNRNLNNGIYLASTLDGRVLKKLVEGGTSGDLESLRFFYSSFDWAPNGRLIAFPAKSSGKDDINIFDVDEGKRVARLRFDIDGIRSPSFSPDSEQLVFAGFDGGRSDLFMCNVDGSSLRRLTQDRYSALSPRFSPDGTKILFTTDRGPETDHDDLRFGPQRMAIYDLATGEIEVLPNQVGKAISPHFSPDGKKIIFVGDRTGISNLYRYNLEDSSVERLTNILTGVSGITAGSPPLSVSRTGNRLVFSAFSGGGWDLFALKDPFEMASCDSSLVTEPQTSSELARRATGLGDLMKDYVADRHRPEPIPIEIEPGSIAADSLITELVRPGAEEENVVSLSGEAATSGSAATGEAKDETEEASESSATSDAGASPYVQVQPPPGGVAGVSGIFASDSLMATLDVLPDTSSFLQRDYKTRFSADYGTAAAAVGGGLGLAGQALVSFSDILGDKRIVVGASVYGSLTDADLFFQYLDQGSRSNKGIAVFQFRNDFLLSTATVQDEYQSNIYRGAEGLISRPFDLFTRVEFSMQAVAVTERLFRNVNLFSSDDREINLGTTFYVKPQIALIKDTALYGSTGPIKGMRARLSVSHAEGGQTFTDLTADLRRYININTRYSLAGRVLTGTSFGENPQIFRAGGPFTNRAVDYGEMEGSNILLTNLEFRFPFIDQLDVAFPLPLRFRGIRGVAFFDAGSAWGDTYLIDSLTPEEAQAQRTFTPWSTQGGFHLEDLKAAYGFGVRMNLGFFLIRWDLAKATDFDSTGKWKGYFALGSEF